jgi:ribulose-5-phosphate 4-epimerase/fuculose-1-phosphate aldolase
MSYQFNLDEEQARDEIIKWGKEIYSRGLVNGTGGNLSIRISPDVVLSTPSGWSLGHMTPESIMKTTIKGEVLEIRVTDHPFPMKPTKELPMHLAVFVARPDICAIAHTHSIYAVTYACTMQPGESMPPYIPSLVAKVGEVGLTPFRLPASQELGEVVSGGVRDSQAVLLENHGVLSVGKTLEAAIGVAFEVEDNARIHFLSGGQARPLPESALSHIKASYK